MPFKHTVLRIFSQMALEKLTRGKPVRERESLLFLRIKIRHEFIVKNPTYLNTKIWPVSCLGFCARLSQFLCNFSSRKMCQNNSFILTSKTVPECLETRVVRTVINAAVRPSISVPQKLTCCLGIHAWSSPQNMCKRVQSVQTERTSIFVLYGLEICAKYK